MDLSDKEELTGLANLIADSRKLAPDYEPLVVGAMARDLLLHYGLNVPVARATEDIDLAFAVADWDEFNSLRDALLASKDFTSGRPASHRLIHRGIVPVDLIPFGGLERSDGNIIWPDDDGVMGVLGYREALASAVEILLPQEQTLLTVSLPMLAVLKLLAWSDRHIRAPRKDATDLFLVLRNYLNGENAERLYAEASHLLDTDDFDYESAGAWLAGHDAGICIAEYSKQPKRVIDALKEILSVEADPNGKLQLIGETGASADLSYGLLTKFYEGFQTMKDRKL